MYGGQGVLFWVSEMSISRMRSTINISLGRKVNPITYDVLTIPDAHDFSFFFPFLFPFPSPSPIPLDKIATPFPSHPSIYYMIPTLRTHACLLFQSSMPK